MEFLSGRVRRDVTGESYYANRTTCRQSGILDPKLWRPAAATLVKLHGVRVNVLGVTKCGIKNAPLDFSLPHSNPIIITCQLRLATIAKF